MTATRRKAKRLLAFLMTLAMLISMVNVPVFAAPTESDAAKTDTKQVTVGGKKYGYTVELPKGYDAGDKTRHYPVIYIMPDDGLSGNAEAFTKAMEGALASSDIMDAIVVKPTFQKDCDVYEVVDAVVKAVDQDYNTVKDSSARAVMGTKVGGYLAAMLTYTVYEEVKPETPVTPITPVTPVTPATPSTPTTPDDIKYPKELKWSGKPNLFGMMASIHGDYVSEANIWKSTYGDFYELSQGNVKTSVTRNFYTYMDSAAEDPLAYADHGANDIISYYIDKGGTYYGSGYGTSAYTIELTVKGSAYTEAFVKKSVEEAIHGFGNKMVQSMVTGSIILKPQAAYATDDSIQAVYDIGISNLYTQYCGDVENDLKVIISMTDPDTGAKVAADKTVTIKVKETKGKDTYKNTDAPLILSNTVNNVSTTVTLSVEILGKAIELESKPLVRIASTGEKPEEQLIDLLGQWHFKAFKKFGEDSEFQVGIENLPKAEAYTTWEEVYPCLGWWDNNHATSQAMKYYSGYAWYIKEFNIPEDFPEGKYVVPVGFFDETDICFINGVQIGCTGLDETTWKHKQDCWDTERIYSIDSSELNIGGKNVMYVLTHNQSGDGGWYSGHPGLYSTAAYNKMTSKPSVVASDADTAIVKAAVDTQQKAIRSKKIDAYAKTVDPGYFQSGKTKNLLIDEVSGYMAGSGDVEAADTNAYVFQSGELFYYQASRTIKKADGETITTDIADYFKIENGTAIMYGMHDRFFGQTIPSEYRAKALKSSNKYEDENFLVYLPEGYFDPENADKRYPTAYIFHQLNSSSNSYAVDGIDKLLDEGIANGDIKDTILVIPDSTGNSWWSGDWASMVTKEILPYVDANFRTITDARYRFTAGASMGGSGSYGIGLENPDLFSGIISFFGAISSPMASALKQSNEYLEYYTHYLVCGNRDLYKFGLPALTMDKKLRSTNAKHYVEIEEGEHDSKFYLPYVIPAFKFQTEDMPAVSPEDAAQVISSEGSSVTSSMIRKGNAKIKADIAVTDKVADYLNTIPASDYTKDTAPELTIPVTLTISEAGKTIITQTQFITAKEAAVKSVSFNVQSRDLLAEGNYDTRITASIMDQTVDAVSSGLTADKVTVGGKDYSYTVTLPAGYNAEDEKRNYPVIYVMPDDGLSGNTKTFTTAMEKALGSSDIMDAIIVEPAFQAGCDVYEVVDALVKEIDKKYNTVAESSARAVIGTKVGGYLATMLTYTVYEEDIPVTPEDIVYPKVVKWSGKPNLFGMMASIHGDYVSEANIWKDTYGDFYNIVSNDGASRGNLSTAVTGRFYTYMDSAAEDSIAYADHGANDVISYYINNGGMYYGGAYTTSSYVIELTAKGSAYTNAFVEKSVSEAIHGFGNKLVQNMVTGSVALKPQAAYASEEAIQAVYDIGISNLYTKYCSDVENDLKVTISMTDPDTGEKVAEDQTVTIPVKETEKDGNYTNGTAPISLPNKVNNVSTTVTLSVEILGKTIELESKPLVRIASTGSEPEDQLIDLLGQWHFKAFKKFGEDSEFQVGIENLPKAEAYTTWEEVYPCLGWWDNNHATSEEMKYYSGYAWYIKEFDIPEDFPEGNYVVPVGFFDETDICFINGVQIGCTGLNETTWTHEADCWDTERIYSIDSSKLNIGGKNVMYVLTHNQSGDGGWYNGHPGLYSTAAYNKMTSKPSIVASEADAAIVKAAVNAQRKAIISKDIDAYAESVDAEYFQSGKTKNMLLEEVSGYMAGSGGITVTDKDAYVFQSGDLFYYQASRTIKKADGKRITSDVADYYKIEDGAAIMYGLHDRFFNQTIPSEYRAKALNESEKYVDENFLVYLPEGYFENPDKRYPTAYVFHQLNSSSNSYAIDGIDKFLDEGIASGAIKDTILVIPDSTGSSWWRGDWVSMVTEEILPYVDSHYRTIQDPRYRFTAGASMGGSGSYNIGLTNPDLFSGIISFFGAINMGAGPLNIALAQTDDYLEYYTHYLVCGNRDLYKFGIPALTLDKKLRTTKAKHYVEIEEGEHDSSFYLPYVIPAFKYQTEDMPSISAEDAAQVVSKGRIISSSVRAGEAKVKAEITVTNKVADYLNTIPESDYTKNTAPELTIPVTLTISKDGKAVITETKLITAKEAAEKSLSFDVKSKDLTASGTYDIKVTASVMDQTIEVVTAEPAVESVVKNVKVYTSVKPTGQTMDSFEVTVTDKTALAGLTKDDFTFTGQASGWMNSTLHEMEGVEITDAAVYNNVLTLTISGVTDRHIYVNNYTVTCTNPAVTFTNAEVTKTITPIADDFKKVRTTDGAEFDYNIFTPADTDKAQPVVVAFHGFGDNENLYQNQLAVTWAAEESQNEWPCYVIAPVVGNYFSADYRNDLYEKTYNLIQKMVKQGKIDKDRIYVVGKSFGGLATYEFLEKYPDDIAGSIAMCGAASASATALADAAKMKDIPLWIAQAASDDTVDISNSRDMYKALQDAGSEVVKFKEYTDEEMNAAGVDGTIVGYHTVEIPVLADRAYREWMFAQNNQARREAREAAEFAQKEADTAVAALTAELKDGDSLPVTETEDVTLTWSTNHTDVTIADGKLAVAKSVTADTDVEFTATVVYKDVTMTAKATVKVKANGIAPEIVAQTAADEAALALPAEIRNGAVLPVTAVEGAELTWSTDHADVTIAEGKLVVSENLTADTNVKFTASVKYDGVTKTAEKSVTVKANGTPQPTAQALADALMKALPAEISDGYTLPMGAAGVTVVWSTDNENVTISGNKLAVSEKVTVDTYVKFTAEVTFQDDTKSAEKIIKVKANGKPEVPPTVEEVADAVAGSIPKDIAEGTSLPMTTKEGAAIVWSTNNAGVTVNADGRVVVADTVTADADVVFTAKVTLNGKETTITKTVKVKGKVPVVVPADKKELNAAITAAEALKEADYTKDTWTAFQTALTAAKTVAAKSNAAQTEVDAAKQALLTAQNGLKKPVPVQPITVSKVTLNKKKVTLGVKETFKLTAKVTPSNAADKKVTWKSSNKKVATVANGKVTAKKKGTAKITATAGGKSVTCTVTVKAAPKKFTVTPKSKTIKKGKSYTLKVKLPKNTASNKITYTSKNKKVATVSASGKVKGIKKGKTTITIKTFNNKKVTVKVIVN